MNFSRRFINTALTFVLVSAVMLIGVGQVAFSEPADCAVLPSVDLVQEAPTTDRYAVWLLLKKETPTATPYIKVDAGKCNEVAMPSSDDWEWVSGPEGKILLGLEAGERTFSFSVNGGAVLIDLSLIHI